MNILRDNRAATMPLLAVFRRNERAATMVEYALLVGLIAIVSIAAIAAVGTNVRCLFEEVAGALANVTGGSYAVSAECGGSGSGGGGGGGGAPDLSALTFNCPAGEVLVGLNAGAPVCAADQTGGGSVSEVDPRNLATIADDGNLCRANDQGEIVCDQTSLGTLPSCADGQTLAFTGGSVVCADLDGATATRYVECDEFDNCPGTPVACNAQIEGADASVEGEFATIAATPELAALAGNSNPFLEPTGPIQFGAWSNTQCGASGSGWHVPNGTCFTNEGTGHRRCLSVIVEQPL